jgi:aminoglycoside phosphotransferase (APT) family kinase protein
VTRPALDLTVMAGRATSVLALAWPGAQVVRLRALPGGASSLTYLAEVAGGTAPRVVVKVAPPGLKPTRNRDVLRQARVLQALEDEGGVAVPTVIGTDVGDPPEAPPFFVMSYVEGDSYEPFTSEEADAPPPDIVEARELAAAAMLAALHGVDHSTRGLGDERVFTLEEEVGRWVRAFESLDDDLRPATTAVCQELLLSHLPRPAPPVIVHGDFRLGNTLCQGRRVAAIIDWEIWSIGDPRVDLAWFLLMADPDRPQVRRIDPGMPAPGRLLASYEDAAAADVDDMAWFAALVRFKQAAAAALITKNNRRLEHPDPEKERHGEFTAALLDHALGYLQ